MPTEKSRVRSKRAAAGFHIDLFCGFSQVEVGGVLPSERRMFENLVTQIQLADELGFGTAWVGGAHFSLQQQNAGPQPPLPHFRGEMCLNTDILPLARHIFSTTEHIAVGSAIRNILTAGGPIAHAEAIRTALTWHSLSLHAHRRLEIGYGAGRLSYANEAYGIRPRTALERAAWPILRPLIFRQASEIFLKLLRGDSLSSTDLTPLVLHAENFTHQADWQALVRYHGRETRAIEVPPYWQFDPIKLIPAETPLDALTLTLGSHDPRAQVEANQILPVRTFNLSITPPSVIDATHARMREHFHPDGGPWQRSYMPRTVMVFVNGDRALSSSSQSTLARTRARGAIEAYQRAMYGTVDEAKLREGVSNTIAGNPAEVAQQLVERFHPEDRIMLWFDFNEHESGVVEDAMTTFITDVLPIAQELRHA